MPAPADFISGWIAAHGPWLFHTTHTPAVRAQLLEQGLIPWDAGPGAQLEAPWTPRPGHVYLGTAVAVLDPFGPCAVEETVVAVDVRGLDPAQLNPDEDVFWSGTLAAEYEDSYVQFGLEDPDVTVWPGLGGDPSQFKYQTYGQWADGNQLGANPALTALSLRRYGLIAHRGPIAAQLLRPAPLQELYDLEARQTGAEAALGAV